MQTHTHTHTHTLTHSLTHSHTHTHTHTHSHTHTLTHSHTHTRVAVGARQLTLNHQGSWSLFVPPLCLSLCFAVWHGFIYKQTRGLRVVGGTTDRNSLSARQANGAAMLMEVDAAAVAVLLLVRLIAEGREVVRRLAVRKEEEQPQKLAVNATRGRHARRQERQRPIASIRLPVVADLVGGGLVKELVGRRSL